MANVTPSDLMRYIKEEIDDKVDCAYVYFFPGKAFRTVFKKKDSNEKETTVLFYPVTIILDKGDSKEKLPIEKYYEKFGEKAAMKYKVTAKRLFVPKFPVITLCIDGHVSEFTDNNGKTIQYFDSQTVMRREQKAFTQKLYEMYYETAKAYEIKVNKEEEQQFLKLL